MTLPPAHDRSCLTILITVSLLKTEDIIKGIEAKTTLQGRPSWFLSPANRSSLFMALGNHKKGCTRAHGGVGHRPRSRLHT
jgi:hypothetical protein